ncbi:hypothetical protein V5O48_003204 [Marasmius crinis-equi]|uniref:Thioesterase-like superfamily-domain-containing protein n=1 Tax=Marasmius crinis-equi TaxID=585013 RepID=A0ABR3FTI2_9AGAR
MAPFYDALKVAFNKKSEDGQLEIYIGDIDGEWCINAVPNGGYVLGLIIEACMQRQAHTKHKDPIHVTAHFLRSAGIAPFEVRIRELKKGRGFTNLTADLVQDNVIQVTTHQIFGVLSSPPNSPESVLTIAPPSPYARRLPLYQHPSTAPIIPLANPYGFLSRLKTTREPELRAKNALDSPTRTNAQSIGGSGLEWGQWLTFMDERQTLSPPAIAFMADMFRSPPSLLPKSERTGLSDVNWFPTVTMTVEFKVPVPKTSSQRTTGLYANCHFVNDPQGRHDIDVEVWSGPCEVGEGKVEEGWREKQVCLAVSRQTSLIVPMHVNEAKSKRKKDNSTPKL